MENTCESHRSDCFGCATDMVAILTEEIGQSPSREVMQTVGVATNTRENDVVDQIIHVLSGHNDEEEDAFVSSFDRGYDICIKSLASLRMQDEVNDKVDAEVNDNQQGDHTEKKKGTTNVKRDDVSESKVDTQLGNIGIESYSVDALNNHEQKVIGEDVVGSFDQYVVGVEPVKHTPERHIHRGICEGKNDLLLEGTSVVPMTVRSVSFDESKNQVFTVVSGQDISEWTEEKEKKKKTDNDRERTDALVLNSQEFSSTNEMIPTQTVKGMVEPSYPHLQQKEDNNKLGRVTSLPTPVVSSWNSDKNQPQKRINEEREELSIEATNKSKNGIKNVGPHGDQFRSELEETMMKFQRRLKEKRGDPYYDRPKEPGKAQETKLQSEISSAVKQLRKVSRHPMPEKSEAAPGKKQNSEKRPEMSGTKNVRLRDVEAIQNQNKELQDGTILKSLEADEVSIELKFEEEGPKNSLLGPSEPKSTEGDEHSVTGSCVSGRISVVNDVVQSMVLKSIQRKKTLDLERQKSKQQNRQKMEERQKILKALVKEKWVEAERMLSLAAEKTDDDILSRDMFSFDSVADSFFDGQVQQVYGGAAADFNTARRTREKREKCLKSSRTAHGPVHFVDVDTDLSCITLDTEIQRKPSRWKKFLRRGISSKA
jgi:hypothetical protein